MDWNYNMDEAPLNTPLRLLSSDDCLLLPQHEYIGTITTHEGGEYLTRGECIEGNPEYFYRSKIIGWKNIDKSEDRKFITTIGIHYILDFPQEIIETLEKAGYIVEYDGQDDEDELYKIYKRIN